MRAFAAFRIATSPASRRRRLRQAPRISAAIAVLSLVAGGLAVVAAAPSVNAAPSLTRITIYPVADTFVEKRAPYHTFGYKSDFYATRQSYNGMVSYLRFKVPYRTRNKLVGATLVLTRTQHHLSGVVYANSAGRVWWRERTMAAFRAPRMGRMLDHKRVYHGTNTVSLNVRRLAWGGHPMNVAITSSLTRGVIGFRSRQARWGRPKLLLTYASTSRPPSGESSTPAGPPSSSAVPSDPGTDPSSPSTSPVSDPPTTPVSTPPTTPPTSSEPPPPPGCTLSAILVPSCGYWWGISPKSHTTIPRDVGTKQDEAEVKTTFRIIHAYHDNGQLFPTSIEKGVALQPDAQRVLLENWKPATDMTWAQVANGAADARIDAEARYLKSTFPYPFFLAVWHEPEDDVNMAAGSGKTAGDYAAMYRHVVLRLRADGVDNAITVMDYMGFDGYALNGWFNQLWPGNDVVDWIGIDPYAAGAASGYRAVDFAKLVNRPDGSFPGYYTWAQQTHPGKPLMLAEWGVYESDSNPGGKAKFFQSMPSELAQLPNIKALVYFDYNDPSIPDGGNTSPDSSSSSLLAFQQLSAYATAHGPDPVYINGDVVLGH